MATGRFRPRYCRCFTPYLALSLLLSFVVDDARADAAVTGCAQAAKVSLQVLGSGGPELTDQRASSSYLIWRGGKASVLVDMGPGAAVAFDRSGARFEDLDALLLTHFHVDHAADLPAFVKGSFFSGRRRPLPVLGPSGNAYLPGTRAYLARLFAVDGVFPYLADYLEPPETSGSYQLLPGEVDANAETAVTTKIADFSVMAVGTHHGPLPAVAWRVELGGVAVVFSGDTSNQRGVLAGLSSAADVFVAHNAIPESATGVARNLHMPPSVIGAIADEAGVDKLVLSHRMSRSLGRESETLNHIRKRFSGQVAFANDFDCFPLAGSITP